MTINTPKERLHTRIMRIATYAVMTFFILTVCNIAFANTVEFQQAFEKSYNNPADVEAALHYSEVATQIGDYESAIAPLERLLMFNPRLSNVRVEVGVLYYLLKSYDMAEQHFSIVMQDTHAPNETKARASEYLQKL
jgi:tetratricopeptide (TPR) repeat protein